MPIKNFLILSLVFSLLLQISFSIYYSSEITTQNIDHKNLLENIDKLETEHQNLQAILATETSLTKLEPYLIGKNYQPIWQLIDLNQP